jgi:hypothetical protein
VTADDFGDRIRAEIARRQAARARRFFPAPDDTEDAPPRTSVNAGTGTRDHEIPKPLTFDDIIRHLAGR